jgi:hypothetical protein
MDNDFWKWFVGMLITGGGMLGIQTRWLQSLIAANTTAIKAGDDALHERVNRVRDELAKDFVRKSDIDAHLARVDETYRDLRTEMREGMKDIADRLDIIAVRRPASTRRRKPRGTV